MQTVQAILAALNRLEWFGILLARLTVGGLFLLSGRGKLFRPDRRERMRQSLRDAGVPLPELNAVVVSTIECVFGALLLIGALTPLACLMLSGVMVVAIATTRLHDVGRPSLLDWLGEFLYFPEVLYLVMLVWLFFSGPGWASVDHLVLDGLSEPG